LLSLSRSCGRVCIILLTRAQFLKNGHSRNSKWTTQKEKPRPTATPLPARRERPRHRRAAEQRDELAPVAHSITSSARASSVESGTRIVCEHRAATRRARR
jgi:hypothetical protein